MIRNGPLEDGGLVVLTEGGDDDWSEGQEQ